MADDLDSLLDQVLHLSALVAADQARFEQTSGLTTSRLHLLWVLGSTGPATQSALADALGLAPRSVTSIVDALAGSGHVVREPHPTDRRAVLVTPTPTGSRCIADLRDSHAALARRLFAAVPPRRLAAFRTTLDETVATFARLMEEET